MDRNDYAFRTVMVDVFSESRLSEKVHPELPADTLRRAALVAEEAGEALRDAVNATRPGVDDGDAQLSEFYMYNELIQTVTMGIRVLMAMRDEFAMKGTITHIGTVPSRTTFPFGDDDAEC